MSRCIEHTIYDNMQASKTYRIPNVIVIEIQGFRIRLIREIRFNDQVERGIEANRPWSFMTTTGLTVQVDSFVCRWGQSSMGLQGRCFVRIPTLFLLLPRDERALARLNELFMFQRAHGDALWC